MTMNSSLARVMTGLDAPEQDVVEQLCYGRWSDVTFQTDRDGTVHVLVRGRRTVFEIDQSDPEHEQWYVDGPDIAIDLTRDLQPVITKVTLYSDEAGTKPVGTWRPHILADGVGPCIECGDRQAVRGAKCEKLSHGVQPPEEWAVATTRACKCGCSDPVINKPHGRQKEYASTKCRKRSNDRERRAARATDVATPVVSEPVLEPEPEVVGQPAPRLVHCVRCDKDGHYVEDCPHPLSRAKAPSAPVAPSTPVDVPVDSPRPVRRKQDPAEGRRVVTCARCYEQGHSIFTCTQASRPAVEIVIAPIEGTVTDDDLTAHNFALLALCRQGLPDRFQYSFKEDVLAMYGVDMNLLDSALRSPERVEIRPESMDEDKRYGVLAFYRGDIEVILGMRAPATPRVIAVYVASRLENDTHRVGHSGGGAGGAKATGTPKTPRQLVTRLRAMGGRELQVELSITEDFVPVTYKGQDLGKIASNGDRKTCEVDFQRVQRKMAAIDRRVTA